MRPVFPTTAALAAGCLAAGFGGVAEAQQRGLQIGIGGYFSAYYMFADQDRDGAGQPANGRRSDDFKREAEIHFKGSTTLDNGLTAGIHVELEAETSTDQIDESYLFFQGSWGRIILGSENSAAYLMSVAGRPVDSFIDSGDPTYRPFQVGGNRAAAISGAAVQGGGGLSYSPIVTGDSEKVTYISPRWAGFQAGLSFTGDNSEEGQVGQVAAKGGSFLGMPLDDRVGAVQNVVEGAVNYEGHFHGARVLAAVTYGHGDIESRAGTSNLASDFNEATAGLNIEYVGLDVGFGYYWSDMGLRRNGDHRVMFGSLGYSFGSFRIGASVTDSMQEAGTTAAVNDGVREDEFRRYAFGGQYAYGPGMQLRASVTYHDLDGPDDGNTASNDTNDSVVVAIGTVISF